MHNATRSEPGHTNVLYILFVHPDTLSSGIKNHLQFWILGGSSPPPPPPPCRLNPEPNSTATINKAILSNAR